MSENVLKGKKVAVLIETEYILKEVKYYKEKFSSLGMEVDFMCNLWGKDNMTIVSDVTTPGEDTEPMDVNIDVADMDVTDYAAVIMTANYCSVRLREIPPMGSLGAIDELKTPPAVKFFCDAMQNKKIVKGALCHALWILTPAPELLKGRKVICHTVVLSDIHNAGAIYVPAKQEVVVDDDLVTGRSIANLEEYTEAIINNMIFRSSAAYCFA